MGILGSGLAGQKAAAAAAARAGAGARETGAGAAAGAAAESRRRNRRGGADGQPRQWLGGPESRTAGGGSVGSCGNGARPWAASRFSRLRAVLQEKILQEKILQEKIILHTSAGNSGCGKRDTERGRPLIGGSVSAAGYLAAPRQGVGHVRDPAAAAARPGVHELLQSVRWRRRRGWRRRRRLWQPAGTFRGGRGNLHLALPPGPSTHRRVCARTHTHTQMNTHTCKFTGGGT